MPDDDIQRQLDRLDRGEERPTDLREARKTFQRPDERPMQGPTLLQRALSRFSTRPQRDDTRRDSR
jgi:hypothetical protein